MNEANKRALKHIKLIKKNAEAILADAKRVCEHITDNDVDWGWTGSLAHYSQELKQISDDMSNLME